MLGFAVLSPAYETADLPRLPRPGSATRFLTTPPPTSASTRPFSIEGSVVVHGGMLANTGAVMRRRLPDDHDLHPVIQISPGAIRCHGRKTLVNREGQARSITKRQSCRAAAPNE